MRTTRTLTNCILWCLGGSVRGMHAPCHACPPTTHAPLPHTPHIHAPCHTHTLPRMTPTTHDPPTCMPPAMHTPCHACPLPHMPPLPHTPPCHAHPPTVDRILDMLLKILPCPNFVAGGKYTPMCFYLAILAKMRNVSAELNIRVRNQERLNYTTLAYSREKSCTSGQ